MDSEYSGYAEPCGLTKSSVCALADACASLHQIRIDIGVEDVCAEEERDYTATGEVRRSTREPDKAGNGHIPIIKLGWGRKLGEQYSK